MYIIPRIISERIQYIFLLLKKSADNILVEIVSETRAALSSYSDVEWLTRDSLEVQNFVNNF